MIRRILLLLFVITGVQAYIYNDSLLLIYGKIVPRIMLLDHTRSDGAERMKLCILYDGADRMVAQKLRKLILENLPGSQGGTFEVSAVSYDEKPERRCAEATALMLLDAPKKKISKAIEFAKRHRLLTFSYSNTLLDEGSAISLAVGKRIHPIVNIAAVKRAGLKLDPMLFQISKIYKERGDK